MFAIPRAARTAALAAGLLAAGLGADWPQFLGPTRDGHSPEKGLLKAFPKKGPAVVWKRDVGEGYSGPVVAGGDLILFHRVGGDEVVECLGAADGKPRWKHARKVDYVDEYGKGNGPRSTPAVAGGKVYALGVDGGLLCLGLKDGKKLWQRDLNKDYEVPKSFFGVGTSPTVEGGLVLVNVGGEGAGVVALDKDTGKEKWKATGDGASYSSPAAATVDGVRHLFFFTRVGLVALDPANGKARFSKRWRSRIDASVNAATPLVIDGHVFLTASYGTGAVLLKVKKDGVEEVWKGDRALSCHFGTPVRVGPHLYGFHGRQEGEPELRCVEWKTGKVRWTKTGFGAGSVIAADGGLVLLSEGGDLVLADATGDGYKEKARASVLAAPVRAHPALADGRLYARDGKKLVCWKMK